MKRNRGRRPYACFIFVLLLATVANLSALDVAYIVGDTTNIGGDTIFINHLADHLGYEVTKIDDNDVDTFSNWSGNFAGIIISDLAVSTYVSALKDTAVGIFTMDRYTEAEFGFGNTNYRPGGHGRRLVNGHNSDYLCNSSADTIFPYQYDNQYLYYYGDLAQDAIIPFNTPDFVGHDSACVILLDSGVTMRDGLPATERRAFCGIFRNPAAMDYCHSWELFDRLVTWVCHDTLNPGVEEYRCWGGPLEIDACWCEMTTSQNDSATYNSEFRFGYDLDDILCFFRLINPERNVPDGHQCDSLRLLFPIFGLGLNGTPADTISDIRYDAFRIVRNKKWHGPPPGMGGDPYQLDSTWVTRWDVVSGNSPVSWDTLDLRAGVDYDAAVLDTFRLRYPEDSIGDTIRFLITGHVLDLWTGDTANNNGLVLKATAVYDSSSNVEYSTPPPIDNAIPSHMTVEAWYSPEENVDVDIIHDLLGEGILDETDRKIIK